MVEVVTKDFVCFYAPQCITSGCLSLPMCWIVLFMKFPRNGLTHCIFLWCGSVAELWNTPTWQL